jgi:hypothetical protein
LQIEPSRVRSDIYFSEALTVYRSFPGLREDSKSKGASLIRDYMTSTCTRCGLRREFKVIDHPLDLIICTRSQCAQFKILLAKLLWSSKFIVGINNCYGGPVPTTMPDAVELHGESSNAIQSELPSNFPGMLNKQGLYTIWEEPPPFNKSSIPSTSRTGKPYMNR